MESVLFYTHCLVGQVLPSSQVLQPSLLIAKSLDPRPHLIYWLNLSESLGVNPMSAGIGTLELYVGQAMEPNAPSLCICLSCWLWHSALFSISRVLCVCWILPCLIFSAQPFPGKSPSTPKELGSSLLVLAHLLGTEVLFLTHSSNRQPWCCGYKL